MTADTMTNERYIFLSQHEDAELTRKEIALGWHFCRSFNNLLVGPGMFEREKCECDKDANAIDVRLTKVKLAAISDLCETTIDELIEGPRVEVLYELNEQIQESLKSLMVKAA